MTTNRLELIIYIPTYNRHEKLKNCLEIISKEIMGLEDKARVYVSNNGSTDDTRKYLESLNYKWLHIRHNKENVGAALNILHCFDLPIQSEFIWLVGDDDYLTPNAISGILSLIEDHPTADYIFCNTKAFPRQQSIEILKKYSETGTVDGGVVKSRKYTGTTLLDFEKLIDPNIADTLLGELMVHCFRQSKVSFDPRDAIDFNVNAVDWDSIDFNTVGKLNVPHTLPFLSSFNAKTKAVYCDVPRTFNFWGSAEWLGEYDFIFPIIILFLISQYKERGFIADDKFIKLLDYYYSLMGDSLTRQINGQSTARPFNAIIKAKMFEFLFYYTNNRLKDPGQKTTPAASHGERARKKAAARPDKQTDKILETSQMVAKSDAITVNPSPAPALTSIIILTHNQLEHTQLCLQSIEQHTNQRFELIIVDNGSTDGTLNYLRKYTNHRNNVHVIANRENLGFAAGNNQGLAVAVGNYLLMLNNDTIVTEGWLTNLLSVFERYSDVGIVGPVSNNVSGPQQIKEVSYQSLEKMHQFAKEWSAAHKEQTIEYRRVVGFCLLTKREVIDRIGGLDEQFGSGNYEDDDFCLRAAAAGYKTRIAQDAFIHHTGSQTFKGAGINYQQNLERNWKIFKTKWGLPQDMPIGTYAIDPHKINLSGLYIPLPPVAAINALIISTPQLEKVEKTAVPSHEMAQPEKISGDTPTQTANAAFQKPTGPDQARLMGQADSENAVSYLPHTESISGMTSIVILTFNQLEYTKKCVKSLRRHTPELHEIIFVDNGSTDGTVKWLKALTQEHKNCKLIDNQKNFGFAKGCNQGMEASQGEFILLLNNDVVVAQGWLSGLLECLKHAPQGGIVGPMTNNISGPQQIDDDSYRSVDFLDKYAAQFRKNYHHRRIPLRRIVGFCMLFKRTLTEQIGMLDESFGTGNFEDDDFCLRAALAGHKNYIAGDVFIHHYGSRSFIGNKINYGAAIADNRKIIDKKWTLNPASPEGKKMAVLRATELADDFYAKGKIDQAVEALINCIKYAPDNHQIYYELTRFFIESKRFSEAWEVVGTMPETAKNELKGLEYAGYAKEGMGHDDEAIAYVDKMLSIDNKYPAALNLQGVLAYKKGEKQQARDFFQKAIEADPGYEEAYTNLGVLYWGMDKKDEALLHLKKGFVLSPTLPDSSSLYYSFVSSLGTFSDAETDFHEACKLYPQHKNLVFLFIDLLIQQGKFDSAMIKVEDALALFGLDDGILGAALAVREKIGPLQIEKAFQKGTLSLCMIVKNEERHLVRCLRSVRDVVDEMIIVDTGSTDKTIDIAKVFGAKVFNFPWTGNFSEARNQSLAHATGDWILVLDADEVIAARHLDELKALIRKRTSSPVAYSIDTRNYTNNTSCIGWTPKDGQYSEEAGAGWIISGKVRLLPRRKDVFFINPVHELVEDSLKNANIPIYPCKIIVHHYGKLDMEREAKKDQDYYLLGKIKYESDPTNLKYIYELAKQAHLLHKYEETVELWLKLLSLIEADHQSPGYQEIAKISYGDPLPEIYIQLASAYLLLERYQDALTAALKTIDAKVKRKEYVVIYAHCEVMVGSLEKASQVLEELAQTTADYPPAMLLMAVIFCLESKNEKARELLQILRQKGVHTTSNLNKFAKQFHRNKKKDEALLILNAVVENKLNNEETMKLLEALQKEQ